MNDSFERAEDRSLVEPEPRQPREVDPDAAYDEYRETDEYARNAAIGARSALMREAAREEVAAPVPEPVRHQSGWGYHWPADPVGELLAEAGGTGAGIQRRMVRAMVRAAAMPETDPERAVQVASAMDYARRLAEHCIEALAWAMAEAAEETGRA